MLLRRLEIHGFKSFAARTVFEFDEGITAIVGPNGSGKSNIADAVRWALGEQSSRLLRTRKTDDVIFAGSANRPAMGMAEVSLTFEDADRRLTLGFSEVTIARRVYRSGEGEYLINRRKVRLRDVLDLLLKANVGQNAYTVVGQGLIDAALSLRPEERRTLLEEAADVKRHHLKMEEARERLAATEQNLIRLADILAEVEPRLRQVERQAKNAHAHHVVAQELALVRRLWYGDQWLRAQSALQLAHRTLQDAEAAARAVDERLTALDGTLAQARAGRQRAAGRLREQEQACAALEADLDGLRGGAALGEQRRLLIAEQAQLATQEQAALREAEAAEAAAAAEARARVDELAAEKQTHAEQLPALQQAGADLAARAAALRLALEAGRKEAFRLAAEVAARRRQLAQLDQREDALDRERGQRQQEEAKLGARLADWEARHQSLEENLRSLENEQAELTRRRGALESSRAEEQAAADRLAARLSALNKRKQQVAAHLEALERLDRSFAGLYDGVRAVLRAADLSPAGPLAPPEDPADSRPADSLRGIVGIVAALIRVPKELDSAVEAALGGHLQDVVVETWQAAEEAIAYLKRTRQGRATFLPLDTVRAASPVPAPKTDGVLGRASTLIDFAPRFRPVVEQLLGRTLVVRDLGTARRLLSSQAAFGQIVTLEGEIVRPSGAVTGGARRETSEAGILGRTRELRDLREEANALENSRAPLSHDLAARQARVAEHQHAEKTLGQTIAGLEDERRTLQAEIARGTEAAQRVAQEVTWLQSLASRVAEERAGLQAAREALHSDIAGLDAKERQAQEAGAALEAEAQEWEDRRLTLGQRLAEVKARVAVLERAGADESRLLRDHEAALARIRQQIASREARLRTCEDELSRLADTDRRQAERTVSLEERLAGLRRGLGAAAEEIEHLTAQEAELQAADSALRADVLAAERRRAKEEVSLQHATDEIQRLRDRLDGEGLDPPPLGDGWAAEARRLLREELGLTPAAVAPTRHVRPAPAVADRPSLGAEAQPPVPLPSDLFTEQEVAMLRQRADRLQNQIRGLGAVNPDAVREHQELKDRYDFLTAQVQDLRATDASLREAITSLEVLVKQQFDTTFEAVSAEFRRCFGVLFGGGSAQLRVVGSEDGHGPGVEVIAQPPGKRVQSLALLSGGERALTASALLLAILRTNPVPFCIMDEVDAALDDVNLARFRREMRELSARTQCILITHNKGTIEAADTLYGISLGDDHASRVISLRLPG